MLDGAASAPGERTAKCTHQHSGGTVRGVWGRADAVSGCGQPPLPGVWGTDRLSVSEKPEWNREKIASVALKGAARALFYKGSTAQSGLPKETVVCLHA